MFIGKTSKECVKLYKELYRKSNEDRNSFLKLCSDSDDIRILNDMLYLNIIFDLIDDLNTWCDN